MDIAICAPNKRVDNNDLRPSWFCYLSNLAAILGRCTGNAQLTQDQTLYVDLGTRLALLMLDHESERKLPEPSPDDCETVRMHNLDRPKGRLFKCL